MFLMGESYCTCAECPIGKDEVFRRYERLKEYGDWQPEYCGCDKVDGAHWAYGYCGDAFDCQKPVKRNRQKENWPCLPESHEPSQEKQTAQNIDIWVSPRSWIYRLGLG